MRVLVFGGNGMLGHKLVQVCRASGLETWVTLRGPVLDERKQAVSCVDVTRRRSVDTAICYVQPDAVVNCIGIVPWRAIIEGPATTIHVNAVFPHVLRDLCLKRSVRMIQISTDCVFSGATGNYTEKDTPDCVDLYGRTKLLGETGDLILRTSFVGPELGSRRGLLEWFRSQDSTIGFSNAYFSGLTTLEVSQIIVTLLTRHGTLRGLYHVAGHRISKHALLESIKAEYGLGTTIVAHPEPCYDRSLDSSLFCTATGYTPPEWPALMSQMHKDETARVAI